MARRATSRRRGGRPPLPALLRRWSLVLVLAAVAFLYYRPLTTYLETRGTLEKRTAEVQALERQRRALERRLAAETSNAALVRDARRLGYVKPGERLYIVKGIPDWRRAREAGPVP
jgi:cell division protein FtsB